jgi:hypothetical protein
VTDIKVTIQEGAENFRGGHMLTGEPTLHHEGVIGCIAPADLYFVNCTCRKWRALAHDYEGDPIPALEAAFIAHRGQAEKVSP